MGLKEQLKALLKKTKKKGPKEPTSLKDSPKKTATWEPYFKLSDEKDDSSTHIYRGSW